MIRFPFEAQSAGVDEWGNQKYVCPACGSIRKADGLMKHVVYEAKKSISEEDRKKHKALLPEK